MKTHNPSQGLVAVITGTIRQAWSSASEEDKHIFEAAVKDVLEPLKIKPFGDSYFLNQHEEGKFDRACSDMQLGQRC